MTIALTLAVLLSTAHGRPLPAYTSGAKQICVTVPDSLVDWRAVARTEVGAGKIDRPDRAFLRSHTGTWGTFLKFSAAPGDAVTSRRWNVLHETGVISLRPAMLRVTVMYDVDAQLSVLGPPHFAGEVCGNAKRSIHAAFVIPDEAVLIGEAKWAIAIVSSDKTPCFNAAECAAKPRTAYTFLWRGGRYRVERPGSAGIERVSVFRRADGTRFLLVRWESDCDWSFTLYEISGENVIESGVNEYGCDL